MIVIDRGELEELLTGRTVVIPDPELRYRKGGIYDVGIRRRVLCRAIVIKIEAEDSVRVQLVYQQQATMLARSSTHGYTDDPAQAVFMEPEAIGPEILETMNRQARQRYLHDRAQLASELAANKASTRLAAIETGTVARTDA